MQKIVEHIGSIQNIELIRYWSSGKLLIVEGSQDDIKILKIFQQILFPDHNIPLDLIPKHYSDGWGGWQKVLGISSIKKSSELIQIYCIFDSDYHTDAEKLERKKEAKKHKIELHIWSKKEIENFLINPSVIFKFIKDSHKKGKPTEKMIIKKIEDLIDKEKDNITDNYADEIRKRGGNKYSAASYNSKARKIIENHWTCIEGKISISPGKQIIKEIISWCIGEFDTTFNKFDLASAFGSQDIDSEIKKVITSIEKKKKFN